MTSELHHLAAAYALDALEEDERRAFEAHYPTCDVCSSEVDDFRSTTAALADSVQTAPPADLKARIMAEVTNTRQIPPIVPERVTDLAERRRRKAPRSTILAVAAAAVVAIAGLVAGLQIDRSSDFEQLVAAPDAVTTTLEPTESASGGSVRVVWSAERSEVAVIADGLPDPGDDMAYQLWSVLDADGVAPAGTFATDDGTFNDLIDGSTDDASGWGITIEPESGSEQPTSDILFVGTF